MIGIMYPKDNWILKWLGKQLIQIGGVLDNQRADITYWLNWGYWEHSGLIKSLFDIVWFTHFENNKRLYILNKADLIVCQSKHGFIQLVEQGISEDKIAICPFAGASTNIKKKIIIGTSGRNYKHTDRKNRKERDRLKKDLDSSVFEFIHKDVTDDTYWKTIDYYLQTSTAEGGAMDILNAIYARVSVVSRDIGYIHSFKTDNDFIYKDYNELLSYFKTVENSIKQKDKVSVNFTWDKYGEWHGELFKECKWIVSQF